MAIWKVLIVEDDSIILKDMLSIIDWKSEGFQTLTAINGRQGIEKAKSELPAFILSDVKLPLTDGLTMLQEISQANPYIKYCIISAYGDFVYARSALRLGVKDYILKADISGKQLSDRLNSMRNEMKITLKSLYTEITAGLDSIICRESPDADISEQLDNLLSPCKFFDNSLLLDNVSSYFFCRTNRRLSDNPEEKAKSSSVDDLKCNILLWLSKKGWHNDAAFDTLLPVVIVNSIKYINGHYSDSDLKIDDIASAVGLSNSRFSVKFKEEVGQTVNEYITDIRIERAKRMLSTGQYKVYEVAERVGYKNSTYFSRIFYEKVGHRPNGYSERNSNG